MRNQEKQFITGLFFALGSLLALGASAQLPKTPLALKPNAPERYVVVPGDTLWSIAERFTDSPWRWPELWNLNKDQIKNPHRIYPGNVIVIDRTRGLLALAGPTVRLSPRVRVESTVEPIPSIPAQIIEPFLTRPLVIEPGGLDNAPRIIALDEGRVLAGDGGKAFVRGIGASKEETWHMYRPGRALVDPETDRTLGHEAVYLGIARVVQGGDPATVVLATVTQEVALGDRLVPAGRPEIISYVPHAPANFMQGRIVSVYGGVRTVGEAGQHSIVALNRGKVDGLELGHVLALYRHRGAATDRHLPKNSPESIVPLPEERYGLTFVFRVFDHVSYALVMNVNRQVSPLDVVRAP